MTQLPRTYRQIQSLLRADGQLELSIAELPLPAPAAHEVLIRIDAAPLNPSDIGVLFAAADPLAGRAASERAWVGTVPAAALPFFAARVDQSMPVGNEGAGVVVAAGDSDAARALVGKTVAVLAGGMYADYRIARAADVIPLPDGAALAGASAHVNPLTALGMVATMRAEGHKALVHTASASQLGQMLNRICLADGVPLVHVVRKPEQAALLREQGAAHVVDSSAATFDAELTDAIAATGATLAFDAIGGGRLASQILAAMERVLLRGTTGYQRYGASTHKQVYIYGALDPRPTELVRTYGMWWSVGGWILNNFLGKTPPAQLGAMRARIGRELTTTFATSYAKVISLADVVAPDVIAQYARRETGGKFAISPSGAVKL